MKQAGKRDYYLGYGPVVELLKCVSRVFEKPCLTGSMMQLIGYAAPWLARRERPVPREVADYINREQLGRLNIFRNLTAPRGARSGT